MDNNETDNGKNVLKNFVHLHLHSEYSLLDGAVRLEKLFEKCSELGFGAVAITDHGNMYGACKFDYAAIYHTLKQKIEAEDWAKLNKKYKVKPIFGCEFYVAEDMDNKTSKDGRSPKFNHLILLAKNYEGYLNLCKLNAESYIRGYYYKPRIDNKLLEKHTKGLICLSACLAGVIPQALLNRDTGSAIKWAEYYKNLFEPGDFYIEIQDHSLPEQKIVLPGLIEVAKKTGVKLVATNDVHYLEKDDYEMQKVLQCISFKRKINETTSLDGGDDYFPTQEFYLKSYEEMHERFGFIEEALSNTVEIADKCDCMLKYKQNLMPSYVPENNLAPYEFLKKLTFDGLSKKYPVITPEIKVRADSELRIIGDSGFVEYFLIVWDFIHYAESIGIPVGPGRGSGVGSIVAYATGITKVDPLKYDLLFERFLNAERVSMPDFDIDFCFERRDEVIDYVIGKYGADKVSQIVTFGTLAMKAAIKDVGRVYDVPYSETDKMTKAIGYGADKHTRIADLVGKGNPDAVIPELKEMYENDPVSQKVLDMAAKIEGMPRQIGMHAAGVVICKDSISDHIPQTKSGEDITTQYDMVECEKLGLLKMDFLGLRTLTDISKALELIEKNTGVKIDFYDMPYDDPKVFELISRGDTHAVFQLESEGMKNFMKQLKPQSMEDIIAGISLFRPGPMDSIPTYVFNKNNPDKVVYDAPGLEKILKVTYGCLVYQEQVMSIARELGGYTMGGADNLRRAMSKKKAEVMAKHKNYFIYGGNVDGKAVSGAVANGVSAEAAAIIYDKVEKFAAYAFNKSHAAAYAFLSYQTAYLKCYYRKEFLTAVLNNRISSADEIRNYLNYARDCGLDVMPPDINRSDAMFATEPTGIRIGLAAVKNVGIGIVNGIISERAKNGVFKDFLDFCKRVEPLGCNKKMFESLIMAGAMDCFNVKRSQMIAVYDSVMEKAAKDRIAAESGQFSMFEVLSELQKIDYPDIPEFDTAQKLKNEKEVVGMYLSGHFLDEYREMLASAEFDTRKLLPAETDDDGDAAVTKYELVSDRQRVSITGILMEASRILTKKNQEMGVGRLEDLYGSVEVMMPQRVYSANKDIFKTGRIVVIEGTITLKDNDPPKIWIDTIKPIDNAGKPEQQEKAPQNFVQELFLRYDVLNIAPNDEQELLEILGSYPGGSTVYAVDKNNTKNKYLMNVKVEINKSLILELIAQLGDSNVKTMKK